MTADRTREPLDDDTKLRAVVAAMGRPAFAVDERSRIVAWNDAAERLFGLGATKAIGQPCHQVVCGLDPHGNLFCRPGCNVAWAVRQGRPVFPFKVSIRTSGGAYRMTNASLVAPPGPGRSGLRLIHLLRPDRTPVVYERTRALTRREKEILWMLAGGKVVKEIAAALSLSVSTVRAHVRNFLKKLGAHSQIEAIVKAFQRGLC